MRKNLTTIAIAAIVTLPSIPSAYSETLTAPQRSVDAIIGESQASGPGVGYVANTTDDLVGVTGSVASVTTVDWGAVQPEHPWCVELDESSHRAIDIYDNAMLIAAINEYLANVCAKDAAASTKWTKRRDDLREAARRHLWDGASGKFIPHIYLEGSPFPKDFDENGIFYHGGTAVAIEADILTRNEIAMSYEKMRENVSRAGASAIGLTLYPPYPKGFFKNPAVNPCSYQNGGDWTWFGARFVRQLARTGFIEEASGALEPMHERVLKHEGFFEWWTPDNQPRGSGTFRGSAGVLIEAIGELRAWAGKHADAGRREPPPRPAATGMVGTL